MARRRPALLFVALLSACGGVPPADPADAGDAPDAGVPPDAAAATDAGPPDAGPSDAGPSDAGPTDADAGRCPAVTVSAVPAGLGLDPFYVKYVDADGIPIVSSARVDDAAFAVARDIVQKMLAGRPDVRAALIDARVRVGIMAVDEVTTDMPEHSDLNDAFPGTDWDARARGLGATLARPLSSAAEENLLRLPGDRYVGESIMVHELSHTIFDLGVARVAGGADVERRLAEAYAAASASGWIRDSYAATSDGEYWAEGVQSWFDTNLEAIPANGIHNAVNTRTELRAADPALAALIEEVFGDGSWRPTCVP